MTTDSADIVSTTHVLRNNAMWLEHMFGQSHVSVPHVARELRDAADLIDRLSDERESLRTDIERESAICKGHVNCISQIYQIAEGPSRDVEGDEVEAVRELKRERDEARKVAAENTALRNALRRCRDHFKDEHRMTLLAFASFCGVTGAVASSWVNEPSDAQPDIVCRR